MKTSELTGAALDWAVAKCEGYQAVYTDGSLRPVFRKCEAVEATWPSYSINWAQAGPIIERELLTICALSKNHFSAGYAVTNSAKSNQTGSTPLIAAMRCYVASKLGDEVDIPKELA